MTTNRIDETFARLRADGHTALVPFVMSGDPDISETPAIMHGLVAGGAHMVEIGMPFSDPMADGAVIQQAAERAIAGGTTLADTFAAVRTFRTRDTTTPVVLMGYMNPIVHMGEDAFAAACADSGVDGVIAVDRPIRGADDAADALRVAHVHAIRLLAPTTTDARLREICAAASGFLYAVSFAGVTGADKWQEDRIADLIARVRRVTDKPIGVGFGIRTKEHVAQVSKYADAVIVGSALVHAIAESPLPPAQAAENYIRSLL